MKGMKKDPVELVREADVVSLTQALVGIPSQYIDQVLAEHQEMACYLADHMKKIGLDVAVAEPVKGYPVVVGTTRSGGETSTMGVIGHYSTVAIGDRGEWTKDPFGAELEDGKIHGRGSADQKGGIAAVLTATRCLLESGLPLKGRLRLIMVPGEGCTEMAVEPVVAQTPDVVRCDVYVDSDGGPQSMSLVSGGFVWLEFVTKGKGAHTGSMTGDGSVPINPLERMVKVVSGIMKPAWMKARRHPLFGPEHGRYSQDPIVELNVFQAGTKVNIIPNVARAQIDIRMLPSQTLEGVLKELDSVLDGLRAEDKDLDVSYQILNKDKSTREAPEDHPVVRAIREACRELGEPEPSLYGSIGGGRAALSSLGPVVSWGAGGGKNVHAPNEYAFVERLVKGARLHARVYTKMLV
jgi:succinyl-diaminopimelate desuccinylase